MKGDELFMQRCIELALHGEGLTAPNPLVGCVIVSGGRIVGEGYHRRYGGPHAEVEAISAMHDSGLLSKATLYVNLEPCSHYGKTPPCADLIVSSGIRRVVVGTADSNPRVSGKGIGKLKEAGIEVTVGVLQVKCRNLNLPFFTWHEKGRPYIILKWAASADGFIDMHRDPDTSPCINWITDSRLKILVHRWRVACDAILVGSNTVRNDNPQLTAREWPGKNPLRVILDPRGTLTPEFRVFDSGAHTLLYTSKEWENGPHLTVKHIPPAIADLPEVVLNDLHDKQVQSLLIEGGAFTLKSFINKGLWDEARIFTGNSTFRSGVPAPDLSEKEFFTSRLGRDTLRICLNTNTFSP
jgi:diaminohydroxyphosphoribosylaminopyrimidine deaminase / 5-amino-6-(5-phosphoribosylamino)uracil reductase